MIKDIMLNRIPEHVQPYVMMEGESIYKAFARISISEVYRIILVAILDMLLEDDKYFLPEVFLYFDDLNNNWEFQGEALAIKRVQISLCLLTKFQKVK